MDIGYLSLLPEVSNKYNVKLAEDEKVVFVADLDMLGTEEGSMIGMGCDFTLTNQRIIIDNHAGIWTINIANDLAGCTKVSGGWFIFKYEYFSVTLNEDVVFDNGNQRLKGFRLYFKKGETAQVVRLEEIINHLFI